ncbi:MAG: hypothetical protein JRI46_10805 [Deltaproteobacteria bacterium]|nr:hypothetical protein [Deltaproteobacteria bacterium]
MEVMIAAAILAVIMGIVYGSFSGSLKTMEIGEERGEAYRKARLILSRMAQEISCAYLPSGEDLPDIAYAFIGEDREEDGLPQDTLNFISTSLLLKGKSKGLKEVGYYITIDPQTDEPTLLMREDTTPDERSDEGGRSYVAGGGISGLDFTYYDAQGREWKRWDSTSPVFGEKLPKVVDISLLLKDERGEIISLTTKVYIPLAGD